jgi:branched-chain amino acid transport system permease protein
MLRLSDLQISRRETIGIALLVAALTALGFALTNNGYFLRIATLILMYAGMAGAWNIISGYGNQVSLGHAAFFGLGAYVSTLMFTNFGLSPWLGMLLAAAAGALLSFVVGVPTFRLRGHYYALATLAVAELMRVLALYYRDITSGAVGLSIPFVPDATWWNFQFFGNRPYFFIAMAKLGVTIAITYWVERGSLGYRLRALKDSHDAAEVAGVDTARVKLQANALSGLLMGAFGAFYAQFQYFIDPDTVFGFWTVSVKVAMIVILGGTGTIWGPLLGACILVSLDEWTNTVFTGEMAALSRILYAVILIALILYRPGGLMSLFQRRVGRQQLPDQDGKPEGGRKWPLLSK